MMLSRRAQISIEVIYSIGVMLVIFLILTGVSFSWRLQFSHTDEYLQKRDECLRLSNYIASVAIGGPGTYANVYTRERSSLSREGYIVVGTLPTGPGPVEVTCGVNANIRDISNLVPLLSHSILNVNGNVTIT
ncbi:MAG: hypothetical protein AABX72_04135 [Nanoarchaeota archaeon]